MVHIHFQTYMHTHTIYADRDTRICFTLFQFVAPVMGLPKRQTWDQRVHAHVLSHSDLVQSLFISLSHTHTPLKGLPKDSGKIALNCVDLIEEDQQVTPVYIHIHIYKYRCICIYIHMYTNMHMCE